VDVDNDELSGQLPDLPQGVGRRPGGHRVDGLRHALPGIRWSVRLIAPRISGSACSIARPTMEVGW
jgi:hypothetical protein